MVCPPQASRVPDHVFRAMVERCETAMAIFDPHAEGHTILFANAAFAAMAGWARDEIEGRPFLFLCGEATKAESRERLSGAAASGEAAVVEILNYRKDGTAFRNRIALDPVRDDEGRLTHVISTQTPIDNSDFASGSDPTAEQLARALARTRELEFAFDQLTDSVIMTEFSPLEEPGPRIVWVNKGFERLTGYTADDVIGKTPRILQGEETDPAVLADLKQSLEAGRSHGELRTVNYKKDGTPFVIEWSVSAIHDDNGEAQSWLAVQRDVTERVRIESERDRLIAELDHRVRNLFSTVQVIVRGVEDGEGGADGLRRRILYQLEALNAAHDIVFRDLDRQAPMGDIVKAVILPFDPEQSFIEIEPGRGGLEAKQAVNAAIILYELVRLSSERGAISRREPVRLSWDKVGDELRMVWREAGTPPEDTRFGFSLVKTFVRSSRWQDAGIAENEDGFEVRLGLRAV